jgi:hypothetical protein
MRKNRKRSSASLALTRPEGGQQREVPPHDRARA